MSRRYALLPLLASLFALYIIWGSTYYVIRVGVESWPPMMMAGFRFLIAGILLFSVLRLRGAPLPNAIALRNAAIVGVLLLTVGNGLVTVAEHQNVPSGIAAVMVATVPLFAMCFSALFGIKTRRIEWLGMTIGLVGIILLNSGGHLAGNPWGAGLILIASLSWAFGSVWGSRVSLPQGLMAGAIEMLAAGVVLLVCSQLSGERLNTMPSASGWFALAYLIFLGSMVAISAYMYLIRSVTPAVATSYAYVNPVVAVLLGVSFAGEMLSSREWLALGVIIFAVIMVTLGKSLFPAKGAITSTQSADKI